MNITLGSVFSDVLGVSAREMLDAIAECEEDPTKLANFARRTMKKRKNELELSLKGYIHSHQRLTKRKETSRNCRCSCHVTYLLLSLNTKINVYRLREDYFDKQRQQSIVRHSLRRFESLGYTVTLQEPEAS